MSNLNDSLQSPFELLLLEIFLKSAGVTFLLIREYVYVFDLTNGSRVQALNQDDSGDNILVVPRPPHLFLPKVLPH